MTLLFSRKFCSFLSVHKTSKRILFLAGCIFSGIPSYGNVDVIWQDFDSLSSEAFWDAIKPKEGRNLAGFEAHRQEMELMIDRIIDDRAHVSYHICDILKSSSDKSVPLMLSPDTVAYLPQDITPCAVKIFPKTSGQQQNLWEHPFDISKPPPPRPPCALLPNGFLIRVYDKTSGAKNESFDLSSLGNGHGFTFLVFIPDTLSDPDDSTSEHIPWCSVIRARIRITNSPQERFVKMIGPQLKIENVSGDGNCAYWAALRSLQEQKKLDDSLDLNEFFFPLPQQLLDRLNEQIITSRHLNGEDSQKYRNLFQLRDELIGSGKPKLTTALLRQYVDANNIPHLNEFCVEWKQDLLQKLTNLNAANPQLACYFLMNHVRRKVSEYAQSLLTAAAWEPMRKNMINAFSLSNPDKARQDWFTIPAELQEGSIDLEALQSLVPDFRDLDWKLYLWGLCAEVDASTYTSLARFRQQARDNFLEDSNPVHYEYLTNMSASELWLGASDVQYLAKALHLPLLLVAPRDQRPLPAHRTSTIKDEVGCFYYDENGKSLLVGIEPHSLKEGDPERIAALLREHPHTVKIVFNGSNHFQAIVRE